MDAVWIALFVILGLAVASFLNVSIDRLPAHQSLLWPASHCDSCHRRLAIKDLVPVVSYLWLRGRCRYCRALVPRRVLWVEVGTGVLFGYLYWHYGLSPELALAAVYGCLFIVLAVIDLEHGLILNRIVYPAALFALLISLLVPPSRLLYPGGMEPYIIGSMLPQPGIAQAAIGGGIGLGLFFLIVVASRGGMGWGDVKMAALIGLITGYLVFVVVLLAGIIGGVVALFLLLFKKKGRRQGIPFAPFLSLATIVTILWGGHLLDWYLGFF